MDDSRLDNERVSASAWEIIARIEAAKRELSNVDTRLEERLKSQASSFTRAIQGIEEDIRALQAAPAQFTEEQKGKILRIVGEFENQNSDKREFEKALRVSVITMIISVLLFSVLVPVLQHYVFH